MHTKILNGFPVDAYLEHGEVALYSVATGKPFGPWLYKKLTRADLYDLASEIAEYEGDQWNNYRTEMLRDERAGI